MRSAVLADSELVAASYTIMRCVLLGVCLGALTLAAPTLDMEAGGATGLTQTETNTCCTHTPLLRHKQNSVSIRPAAH